MLGSSPIQKPIGTERHKVMYLVKTHVDEIAALQEFKGLKRKLGVTMPIVRASLPKLQKLDNDNTMSPADYVVQVFKENGYDLQENPSLISVRFLQPTEERVAAYKIETVKAARSESVEELRKLYASGESLDCCNRFGESLVSMVCRRGNADVVRFLVKEANVTLLLRDDYGRTCLHDAFWTAQPAKELVEFLLQEVPDLLFVKDVRGHAPLDYVRNEHWDEWTTFFHERRGMLRPKLSTRC
jgi:ankyrin repeat protein